MQTEDLSKLIKRGSSEEPIIFSDEELDITFDEQEEPSYQSQSLFEITNLAEWFGSNIENLTTIRKPSVTLVGVDQTEQLLLTVRVLRNPDGSEKRRMVIFDNANTTPVLSLPAIDMQIYNNGFRIVHDLQNGIYLKSYGIRVGLVVVFCNDIDNVIVPYSIVKVKKKNTQIDLLTYDPVITRNKLAESVDLEALQLRYRQSSKSSDLTTNLDAVKWLLDRQTTIEDVNHHIQIDNVIIEMLY